MNTNCVFILKTLSVWLVLIFICESLMADNRAFQKNYKYQKGEARLALIIGNSDYQDSPLVNPVNDAVDIAQAVKDMGFKVMLLKNATHREMGKAITSFGNQLKVNRGVGLFFFAGHGMQVKGRNYLVPVKSNIASEDDIEYSAIDAGRVLAKMESAGNPLNIVILDACRNNPFARSFRSGSRGLAQMDAPAGSLVVYATGPGSVAADGDGRNGIFTKHFLKQMKTSDQDVEIMLRGVRRGVMDDTDGRQTPWSSSSLQGSFKFKTGTAVAGGSFEVEGDASQADMVLIPAGEFEMGDNSGESDEKPAHRVYLDGFYIDTYEVTVASYRKCVNSGACQEFRTQYWSGEDQGTSSYCNWTSSGRDNHPINCVDWKNAKNYCQFVNKRLPTEAEWEKTATWKNDRKHTYPSGKSSVSCSDAVMSDGGIGCGKNSTWPVGSMPQEINGTYDMAGNVWEWVEDWYGAYSGSDQRNPNGASSGSSRVNRGGGWFGPSTNLRGAYRGSTTPTDRYSYLGFRCAVSP